MSAPRAVTLAIAALLAVAGATGPAPPATAAPPPAIAASDAVQHVRVEMVRPAIENRATLRFLKAHRDMILARLQPLRGGRKPELDDAGQLDPRFLEYRRMLGEIAASKDSVTLAYDARERTMLYESVADMAKLEVELDQMERLLDTQRARLAMLQADFSGRQRTELDLLVTGGTIAGQVDSVRVTLEDGTSVATGVTETQRASIQHGGVLEVFRGLIEPRQQVIEVALMGEGWSSTGHGFITIEPARDRLTFLKLDLSQAKPVLGIGSVLAGTWQLDPTVPSAEVTRERP
jgi:hypothetical protein